MTADPSFRQRRARLAEALARHGGGVAVIAAAPPRRRNADNDHPYRQDSTFAYLTGFPEPGAWLFVRDDGRSTLLCRARDDEAELWDGARLRPEAAAGALDIDRAEDAARLDAVAAELLDGAPAVWCGFDTPEPLAPQVAGWIAALRGRFMSGAVAPTAVRDLDPLIGDLRLVKDATEQATMRRAARIAAAGHARAMRFVGRHLAADPLAAVAEYEVEAELLHEFRRQGASGPAYETIVAAGAHACVMHYPAGRSLLRPGELCLIDAGCEVDGYASDITRTFPVNGRFDAPQRQLYDIVLAAQAAAVSATRPGARLRDAHHAAVRVLAEGMLAVGLLDAKRVGDVDAVIESAAYRRFYMHGTGHWLGRDVHDAGDYLAQDEPPSDQIDGKGQRVVAKPSRVLVPGMVVTIEPGLYVRPAEDVPERFWHLGIRIEDDAIVNVTGCELISRGVPVDADAIEALMRGEGETA